MFETGDCDNDQDKILENLEESISHAYSQRKGRIFFVLNQFEHERCRHHLEMGGTNVPSARK